jgi:hypothetical protein
MMFTLCAGINCIMSHLSRGLLSEDNDDVRPPSLVHLHSYVEYDQLFCRHWQLNDGLFVVTGS